MKWGIGVTLLYVTMIMVLLVGEIKCLIKFVKCDFEPSYKAEIIYGVGTITGLGVVIGYLDLGK